MEGVGCRACLALARHEAVLSIRLPVPCRPQLRRRAQSSRGLGNDPLADLKREVRGWCGRALAGLLRL